MHAKAPYTVRLEGELQQKLLAAAGHSFLLFGSQTAAVHAMGSSCFLL